VRGRLAPFREVRCPPSFVLRCRGRAHTQRVRFLAGLVAGAMMPLFAGCSDQSTAARVQAYVNARGWTPFSVLHCPRTFHESDAAVCTFRAASSAARWQGLVTVRDGEVASVALGLGDRFDSYRGAH
jgi:hypothetical protein